MAQERRALAEFWLPDPAILASPVLYHVRQYRPAYVSGFENEVYHNVAPAALTTMPFCAAFRHTDFSHFSVGPYTNDELIIKAHYRNGTHWVVAFAAETGSAAARNWRYATTTEENR